MRRIYIESILGVCLCFLASLALYEVIVFKFNTDDEIVLAQYEAEAFQQVIDGIAVSQGVESAEKALAHYAQGSKNVLTIYQEQDEKPQLVKDYRQDFPLKQAFLDYDELWLTLTGGNNWYRISPDIDQQVYQHIDLEDSLIWLFFVCGFVLYSFCHLFIIFRRVKQLEQATIHFSKGDFSYRVDTSNGATLGRLNHAFNHMADKVSQLIDANRSLTNAIAHEMRTPIFRIQWQADLLRETPMSDQQRSKLDSIVEDTEEMEMMVDELLYYARLDSGRCQLTLETIAVEPFITDLIARWQSETKLQLGVKWRCAYAEQSSIALIADRRLFKRALENLVRNAFKYASSQIVIELVENERQQLGIAVHDDGPGVPFEQREHLFEPFYVGNKARNKTQSGHGLGLSIVDKICIQHDAYVEVEDSPLLGGAMFTMTFNFVTE